MSFFSNLAARFTNWRKASQPTPQVQPQIIQAPPVIIPQVQAAPLQVFVPTPVVQTPPPVAPQVVAAPVAPFPPPSADQSGCGNGDATRVWHMVDYTKGLGYYIDRSVVEVP